MKTLFVAALLLVIGWVSVPRAARAQSSLLPPERVEREHPLPPWSAALVPTLMTTGAIVASAAMKDNNAGFWLAAVSLWWLPSTGNVLLGNYRWAGAWWALRTMGMAMMLPATIDFRAHGHIAPTPGAGRVAAYFIFGALMTVCGFVADIVSAHHYATQLKRGEVIFRQATFTPVITPRQTGVSFAFVF